MAKKSAMARKFFGFRLLWPFSAVFGTALLAISNPQRIEGASNDVVSDTWKVLYTAAANEHNGVFLQIVPDPRDIGGDFYTVCEANTGDFTQGRIGFLWRHGIYANANSPFLRTALKGWGAGFPAHFLPSSSDQLVNSGHRCFKLRQINLNEVSSGKGSRLSELGNLFFL